jgi:hypothetical protein
MSVTRATQRAIDRGIPNHQIASHQDFGGERGVAQITPLTLERLS